MCLLTITKDQVVLSGSASKNEREPGHLKYPYLFISLYLYSLIGYITFYVSVISIMFFHSVCQQQTQRQDQGNHATVPSHSVSNCKCK